MRLKFWAKPPVEEKASKVGAAIVTSPGQAAWTPRDYANMADEGYSRNVVAYRAITALAQSVASVRWEHWRGEDQITESPVLDLFKRPNPMQTMAEVVESLVAYGCISGNIYAERLVLDGVPRELYAKRSDRMSILQGKDGFPSGYRYSVNGRHIDWPVDENRKCDILHVKRFNPLNDWYGMSPIEAGAYAVDQHNEAMTWMQALLQNSATPSGALVVKDGGELSDDQFARLKSEIEQTYQGSRNAGRPMVLEGGMEWQAMSFSPSDMAILETKYSAARDICLAFGVPPMLLGIPGDNTYANYAEARMAFWEDSVIPMAHALAESLSNWLLDDGTEICPNFDHIPAVQEKMASKWERVLSATGVLTKNEIRAELGFEAIEGGDEVQQPVAIDPTQADQKAMRVAYGNLNWS